MNEFVSELSFGVAIKTVLNVKAHQKAADKIKVLIEFTRKVVGPSKGEELASKLYCFLRLLFPDLDTERGSFGVKEAGLARIISAAASLPPDQKHRLEKWRDPGVNRQAGDFAAVAIDVLRYRISSGQPTQTFATINQILDSIVAAGAAERHAIFQAQILTQFSLPELELFLRIILKTVGLSIGSETAVKRILNACMSTPVATVQEMFSRTGNLKLVIKAAVAGETAMPTMMFSAISPMLADRLLPQNIPGLEHKEFILEKKLDGERLLAHVDKDKGVVKLFSRNGKDITDLHGPQLSQRLLDSLNGSGAIFDGELVTVEEAPRASGLLNKTIVDLPSSSRPKILPFGKNKSVAALFNKGSLSTEPSIHVAYFVFDILLYTDKGKKQHDLRGTPLLDRKALLTRVLVPSLGYVEVLPYLTVLEPAAITDQLNLAIEAGEEGIMLKDPNSRYVFGARKAGWLKVKPDYDGNHSETIDLVVVGGYLGDSKGRHGEDRTVGTSRASLKGVTAFLVAARESTDSEILVPICGVGSGFSDWELEKMRDVLQPTISPVPPSNIVAWQPKKKEKPDVWFGAPFPIVVEVRAGQAIESSNYPGRVTLRFPRALAVRAKSWKECATVSEVEDMQTASKPEDGPGSREDKNEPAIEQKAVKRRGDDTAETPLKKARPNNKTAISSGVKLLSPLADVVGPATSSNLGLPLSGVSLFIPNGPELVAQAQRLGATLHPQYLRGKTNHVLADRVDFKVENLVKAIKVDVLNASWLKDCEEAGRAIELEARHILKKA